MAWLSLCIVLVLAGTGQAALAQGSAHFTSEGPLETNSGQMMVEWQAQGPVTLEMARAQDFAGAEPLYRGNYESYFLSGLPDGDYYLRLIDAVGEPSDPIRLTVAHSSLAQALWLLLAGLVVTIGIIFTILKGARDE